MKPNEPISGSFFEPIKGVYKITNTVTGYCYIGQSVNVQSRVASHFQHLSDGKHPSKKMKRDWRRYGADSFIIEVIAIVNSKERRLDTENYHIERCLDKGHSLYNFNTEPKPKKIKRENMRRSNFIRDRMGRYELRLKKSGKAHISSDRA